ncbi:unnamed protein product [Xylocopa violacea]|uniref:Uncharacterized protein n=1 Tax=Xylocopa violacea TaxID=135666 RepID=A0ABP1NDI9_XYLVO
MSTTDIDDPQLSTRPTKTKETSIVLSRNATVVPRKVPLSKLDLDGGKRVRRVARVGNKTVMAVNNCRAGTTRSPDKFVRLTGNTLCSSLMKIIWCTPTARGWYARYKARLSRRSIYTPFAHGFPPSVDLFPMMPAFSLASNRIVACSIATLRNYYKPPFV